MSDAKLPDPALSSAAPRIALLDIARGIAILAMVVFHFTWDLRFYEFITLDVTADPGWIAFQRMIVGSFVFLSGISLYLAHANGIRWRPFWRRFAILAGAALLVTAGTLAFSPQAFVFFGVLHALALFALLGLAFVHLPVMAVLGVAAMILALPIVIADPVFGSRWLGWIGLYDTPPVAEDLVPVFPWFGVFLLGMALARIVRDNAITEKAAALSFGRIGAGLAAMGRWSLVIYLVHQPLLLAALYPVAMVVQPQDGFHEAQFMQSCEAQCYASSGYAEFCTAYCGCTFERIESEGLWAMLDDPQPGSQEETALTELANQCTAEVVDLQ